MKRLALLWTLGVGAMDAVTGLLLLFQPALVLRLLGIQEAVPENYLNWIGVFVASVGASYALAWRGGAEAETVWRFTALVRMAVALFLGTKVAMGAMPAAWLTVAASDAVVALVQIAGLRLGWWKDRPQ